MGQVPGLGTAILVFALIPAICEELAFRGFILSGLERQHRTRSAILLSALMFGFLHVLLSLFQQLFNATLLGIILGLLAVRSRSILPGILFHFLNNAIGVARGYLVRRRGRREPSPVGSIASPRTGFIMAVGLRRVCSFRADWCISCTRGSRARRATESRSIRARSSPCIDDGSILLGSWGIKPG